MSEGIPQNHVGDPESESVPGSSPTMAKSELAGGTALAELADRRPLELDSHPISPNGAGGYENGRRGR
jgi:hypothetical protein